MDLTTPWLIISFWVDFYALEEYLIRISVCYYPISVAEVPIFLEDLPVAHIMDNQRIVPIFETTRNYHL